MCTWNDGRQSSPASCPKFDVSLFQAAHLQREYFHGRQFERLCSRPTHSSVRDPPICHVFERATCVLHGATVQIGLPFFRPLAGFPTAYWLPSCRRARYSIRGRRLNLSEQASRAMRQGSSVLCAVLRFVGQDVNIWLGGLGIERRVGVAGEARRPKYKFGRRPGMGARRKLLREGQGRRYRRLSL
ncbi:hypothetical protein BV25DRAFT_99383 [Artomyces pyxidatus]|uniref:Uncharacterized protein n=1 Tax=Artomyces pyxidatus TaxID=48021 RepID=A0ACB8TL64_9AGAM|nr:hypothetical protein BV25DRAFT_99383 [Artomyces pyxidatus]